MTARTKVVASVILLAGVFLLGFLPQYLQKRRLEEEVRTHAGTISSLQFSSRINDLQGLAGLTLIEALRQNYGLAAEHSVKYFTQLQALIDETSNPELKGALEQLATGRDSITASLAQADPGSTVRLQALFAQTNAAIRRLP